MFTTHHSPLTTHHSPLTTHHSPLTTHQKIMPFFLAQHVASGTQPAESASEGAVRHGARRHVAVPLGQVPPRNIEWLWPGRIAIGRLTLIAGEPSAGKSFVAQEVIARTTRGGPWPDGAETSTPGSIVLWAGRDDLAESVRPRLDALGADVDRIVTVQAAATAGGADASPAHLDPPCALDADLDATEIDSVVESTAGCRLVVVDPLSLRLTPGAALDASSARRVRSLARLAARRRLAVVAVVQVEGKSYGAALEHAVRCLAAEGDVAALWQIDRAAAQPDPGQTRRRCTVVKQSLAPEGPGMDFELGDKRVVWGVTSANMPPANSMPGCTAREFASDWLSRALADGAIESKELFAMAATAGIAETTLRRAASELGLRPCKPNSRGPWIWRPPNQDRQDHQDRQDDQGRG
jgi:hypothetical protein